MAITAEIVENSVSWYDPKVKINDPVVFQNMNYADGNTQSISRSVHRYIQDYGHRVIPNRVIRGISPSITGTDSLITLSDGYAIIAGRYIKVTGGTFDATGSTEGQNYLILRVGSFTEGGTREPTNETASVVAVLKSGYVASHNDEILAEFTFATGNVTAITDNVYPSGMEAAYIMPPLASPDSSSGFSSVVFLTGQYIRNKSMTLSGTSVRVHTRVELADQVGSTDVNIINKSGSVLFRDLSDTSYIGADANSYSIGGTSVVDSSRGLVNITSLNTHTIPSGTDTFVMRDTTDTLTNKTLTSPTVNGGVISSSILVTPSIRDSSGTEYYNFVPSNLTSDVNVTLPLLTGADTFVFESHTQTLVNKTLTYPTISTVKPGSGSSNTVTFPDITDTLITKTSTDTLTNKVLGTLVVNDSDSSNTVNIVMPNTTANINLTIAQSNSDNFVFEGFTQTLNNKTLNTPTISDFTNATHDHSTDAKGGLVPVSSLSGTLPVGSGGTGKTTWTNNGVLYAFNATTLTNVVSDVGYAFLLQGIGGAPVWKMPIIELTGDVTGISNSMDSNGKISFATTVDETQHTHSMPILGIEKVVYNANEILAGVSGSATATKTPSIGAVVAELQNSTTGSVFFGLPYVVNKTVTNLSAVIKSTVASGTFTFYMKVKAVDSSGAISTLASTSASIGAGNFATLTVTTNWTSSSSTTSIFIEFYASTTLVYCNFYSILVDYST